MADQSVAVEYRPVQGFPGYRVGSDGSVWSCWLRQGRKPAIMTDVWKIRKPVPFASGSGYLSIILIGPQARKAFQLHRLVCLIFHGPCPAGMQCCHEDGVKTNCASSNLRWDTPKNNCADKIRHGTHQVGKDNGKSKLTEADVRQIRKMIAAGEPLKYISFDFPVTESAIGDIARGRTWGHVT